jgi:hypothetical protein
MQLNKRFTQWNKEYLRTWEFENLHLYLLEIDKKKYDQLLYFGNCLSYEHNL